MRKNAVVEALEEIVGTDAIEYISGEVLDVGTESCHLSEKRGSVYGIAIKVEKQSDRTEIMKKLKDSMGKRIGGVGDWKPIRGNYYPLYCGKDINMGIRLHSHTKSMKSTGTLQLNSVDKNALENYRIIYGALPCINFEAHEEELHAEYPDLLKTKKSKGEDQIKMEDFNPDED